MNKVEYALQRIASKSSKIIYNINWANNYNKNSSNVDLIGIRSFLKKVGVESGSTLLLHASWNRIDSGKFTPNELIKMLLDELGGNGTLVMPAYPPYRMQKEGVVFKKNLPSGAGLLSDFYRRYPSVARSINLNHSVVASGLHANYLTADHHLSTTSCDKYSPYYRLRDIEDAWIIGLGVGHRLNVATSLHCVESILENEIPYYSSLFGEKVSYCWVDDINNEKVELFFKRRIGRYYTPKIAKHFNSNELKEDIVDGLEVYAIRAKLLIDRSIELGKVGKTMFIWPIPWKYYF